MLAASGALALPGCAAGIRPTLARDACLPRVNVAADRVIRTLVGLRTFRPSGFVVRAEGFGDKTLVHNYGHGGSGITLSWGTSRLATNLGLPGHQGPVAVLGAGVMGLSTARLVQEAGFEVTLYAKALPPETTSNIAGGQFHPYAVFRDDSVTPEFRTQFARALDYSWRRFQIMVGDEYGIRWLPTYVESDSPEAQPIAFFPPVNRVLSQAEHPFPLQKVLRYDTMYVETGHYLRQMLRDVQIAGKILVQPTDLRRRHVHHHVELARAESLECRGVVRRRIVIHRLDTHVGRIVEPGVLDDRYVIVRGPFF